MITIPERDWKIIRDLKQELLNVACEQIFQHIEKLSADRSGLQHKTYLELYKLIQKEDDKIAQRGQVLPRAPSNTKERKFVSLGIHCYSLAGVTNSTLLCQRLMPF